MSQHKGPVFPCAEKRVYAYQDERIAGGGCLIANESNRPEPDQHRPLSECRACELRIAGHTGRSVHVELRIERLDVIEQRREKGFAVLTDTYSTTMSFAELCNRIFWPGCEVYENPESFPESVKEAMKKAYPR